MSFHGKILIVLSVFSLLFLDSCGESSSSANANNGSEVVDGILTDYRDGSTYKVVTIGTQTWMAENLNYEMGKSYCYNNDLTNCVKYGRLYTWFAAKTACPSGWHLPSTVEWEMLFNAVGGPSVAGRVLKSRMGWVVFNNAIVSGNNGTDDFGFGALPAGQWLIDGSFYSEGYSAYFWSASEDGNGNAYQVLMGYGIGDNVLLGELYREYGNSVRCVQN